MAPAILSTTTTFSASATTASLTAAAAAASISSATPTPAAPRNLDAGPPSWVIGIVLAWLGIFITLAVTCFLAQFPSLLMWWDKMFNNRASLHERERTARRQCEHGRPRAWSTVFAHSEGDVAGFRKRKPRGLSVDTGVRGRVDGLGIDMLESTSAPSVKKRVSFDPTVTVRERSAFTATTAPLPNTKTFLRSPREDHSSFSDNGVHSHSDIETRRRMPKDADLEDHSGERRPSPYFRSAAAGETGGKVEGRGWLRHLNRGVYKIADRLAAVLYDDVDRPEEGLLLPIREHERESWMGKGID